VTIFYRQDDEPIPAPGLIVLGKITAGVEAFVGRGATTVMIERASAAHGRSQK
jgi:hypothetical protein